MIEVKINGGVITVNNLASGDTLTAGTLPPSLVAILRAGGLVPYIDKYKKFAMD
ncbi:hypothetical protein FACS1894206_02420 [Deltaproteobacteria bacterium]|nr:hypothetical protein FACS1894206_02420 [Deltaproteobacteria bacterium]